MRIKNIILAIGVLALAVGAWTLCTKKDAPEKISVDAAHINELRNIVQLCSVEFVNDLPVVDTIGNKVMFAVQKQRGSISFGLDSLVVDLSGDTIAIVLPRENIEVWESTEPDSWKVVDTKAIGALSMIRSGNFSLEEENALKAHVREKTIKSLRDNGTIARARSEAATTIAVMMEKIYRKPVKVIM